MPITASPSPLDLTALTLGARDGLGAIHGGPLVAMLRRIMEAATGLRLARPLANPRLEMLRQSGAKLQRNRKLNDGDRAALAAVGLTPSSASRLLLAAGRA